MALMMTAVAAVAGAFLFDAFNVPAGPLIGAAVAVALVTMSPLQAAELPGGVGFLTYAGVGWMIGQSFTRDVVGEIGRMALPIVGAVVLLLVAGGLVAFFLTACCGFGPSTAFLAASPGGLTQMSALAAAFSADPSLVVTLHIVRVMTVVLLSPLIVRFVGAA